MQHSFTKKMHRMQYETIMYITVLLKKKKTLQKEDFGLVVYIV